MSVKEIERKYLVRLTGPLPPDEVMEVRQGYLVVRPKVEWRLREVRWVIKGERSFRWSDRFFPHWGTGNPEWHTALKFGNGFVRVELETRVPIWLGRFMSRWVPVFLEKTRVSVREWSIDIFKNHLEGLVLAEFELPDVNDLAPKLPTNVDLLADLTEQKVFANKRLSLLDAYEAKKLVVSWYDAHREGFCLAPLTGDKVQFVRCRREAESCGLNLGVTLSQGANPIHQDAEGWWFWDETWADRHGPYPTARRAKNELSRYADWLDNGQTPVPYCEQFPEDCQPMLNVVYEGAR